ncbi:M15 family metallopeptidase, partial [Lysobacter sp. 2RAB21]
LRPQGLRLHIYDCYRPVRAVRDFVRWAGDLSDQKTKSRYYPALDKRVLLGDYISPTSGHSRGATLDLGLMESQAGGDRIVDMGTGFDYFDERAHTDSPDITAAQRANRQRLRAAMQREGFENYPLEWWHYTYKPE